MKFAFNLEIITDGKIINDPHCNRGDFYTHLLVIGNTVMPVDDPFKSLHESLFKIYNSLPDGNKSLFYELLNCINRYVASETSISTQEALLLNEYWGEE